MLKVVIMIKYFISPQFLAHFASWSDVWRSLTLNFQNGKHFSTVSGNWTRISPMGANNSTTELLPWQLTCLKCYAGNHNRWWFFMIVHKLYTEGVGKSTKWHGTYIPLPRLPSDSDSMVGAEIAGRSMPDEHPPVGPSPPIPAVPNTLCMMYEWFLYASHACTLRLWCPSLVMVNVTVRCVYDVCVRQNVRWVCFNDIVWYIFLTTVIVI